MPLWFQFTKKKKLHELISEMLQVKCIFAIRKFNLIFLVTNPNSKLYNYFGRTTSLLRRAGVCCVQTAKLHFLKGKIRSKLQFVIWQILANCICKVMPSVRKRCIYSFKCRIKRAITKIDCFGWPKNMFWWQRCWYEVISSHRWSS